MAQPELVGSVEERRAPGQSPPELHEPPAFDRIAIDRAYRYHRARRLARIQQRRESRFARLRFWSVACGLLLICLVIGVTIWGQVQRLFGL